MVHASPTPAVPVLDIAERYDQVVSLVLSCPGFVRAVAEGMDREDLLQEVLCRLAARQRMASRWNPARADLSTYVWLFTSSCCSQQLRKHRAQAAEEPTGDGYGQAEAHAEAPIPEPQVVARELGLTQAEVALVRRLAEGRARRGDEARATALARKIRRLSNG